MDEAFCTRCRALWGAAYPLAPYIQPWIGWKVTGSLLLEWKRVRQFAAVERADTTQFRQTGFVPLMLLVERSALCGRVFDFHWR